MGRRAHEVIGGDGLVRVLESRCPTCIFWPGTRAGLRPGRFEEVVTANLQADALLTCHETLPGNPVDPAVCAGFWARHRRDVAAGRLAHLIGITRIPPPAKD